MTKQLDSERTRRPLVSVVIPCFNQVRYLRDAIESVVKQSYTRHEIVVVDDGSTDDSARIPLEYSEIKLICQNNRGLSAARNAGLAASVGEYVVFLDADDRLLPEALESAVACIEAQPECAFVYGRYELIGVDGEPLSSSPVRRTIGDYYLDLLRYNYIGMHATVMYRRSLLEAVGGFNTSLRACEDYDLFLRIARLHPIRAHDGVVAQYRQHGANMSRNAGLMLKSSLFVLRSQQKHIRRDKEVLKAYRQGLENWREYYGSRLLKSLGSSAHDRKWKLVIVGVLTLLRYHPSGILIRIYQRLSRATARAKALIDRAASIG